VLVWPGSGLVWSGLSCCMAAGRLVWPTVGVLVWSDLDWSGLIWSVLWWWWLVVCLWCVVGLLAWAGQCCVREWLAVSSL
jgi:hypothetical protein